MNRQTWIKCVGCGKRGHFCYVPMCCPKCFRVGQWSNAPLEMPRRKVDWAKVVKAFEFVPNRVGGGAPEHRDVERAEGRCRVSVVDRWPREFGETLEAARGEEAIGVEVVRSVGTLGVWVEIEMWYRGKGGRS